VIWHLKNTREKTLVHKCWYLQEIWSLLETAVQNTAADKQSNCVQHALQKEDLLWELDGAADNTTQQEFVYVNLFMTSG
jgi:hypothetical protein